MCALRIHKLRQHTAEILLLGRHAEHNTFGAHVSVESLPRARGSAMPSLDPRLSRQPLASSPVSSPSNDKQRHDGKHRKHHVVDRSRNWVSAGKVLTKGQPSKPEHEPELRDEQEEERDAPHPKSHR
jgi:hypothetical protein